MTEAGARRVVVVDDDPDTVELLGMQLEHLSWSARSASTAGEALGVVAELDPEVAIIDLGMPDVSGFDLARELRRRLGDRRVRLVALTGRSDSTDRAAAVAAGFDHFMVKPVRIHALDQALRRPA